jgi:hypothetical protein
MLISKQHSSKLSLTPRTSSGSGRWSFGRSQKFLYSSTSLIAYELTCPLSKVKNIGVLLKFLKKKKKKRKKKKEGSTIEKMQRNIIMLFKTKLENRVYANLNITFQLFRTRLDHVKSLQSVQVRS